MDDGFCVNCGSKAAGTWAGRPICAACSDPAMLRKNIHEQLEDVFTQIAKQREAKVVAAIAAIVGSDPKMAVSFADALLNCLRNPEGFAEEREALCRTFEMVKKAAGEIQDEFVDFFTTAPDQAAAEAGCPPWTCLHCGQQFTYEEDAIVHSNNCRRSPANDQAPL